MKNLIGKKARGFEFKDRVYHDISFKDAMRRQIGEIGIIDDCTDVSYRIRFKGWSWWYPAELIEQHLVDHDLTEKTEPYTDAIKEAIIKAYFNGTSLPQIRESIRQAYTAIEAGVNAQLVEIKEERGKL